MWLTCFDCTLAIMTQPDAEMHKQLAQFMHQTATGISLVFTAIWLTKAF